MLTADHVKSFATSKSKVHSTVGRDREIGLACGFGAYGRALTRFGRTTGERVVRWSEKAPIDLRAFKFAQRRLLICDQCSSAQPVLLDVSFEKSRDRAQLELEPGKNAGLVPSRPKPVGKETTSSA